MTDYIDTYVACADKDTLETFARPFVNYIQPQQGKAATEETTDEEGGTIPAHAAVGDPSLWYTCVRATFDLSASVTSPLSVVDAATGVAVVGVFA